MANRPLGVTILCILGWLGAIFAILGGLALLGIGAIAGIVGSSLGGLLGGLGIVLGIVVLIIGIANLVVLYWLWQMKKQGWTWTMIIEIIGLVLSLVQMNVTGLIIPAIIVIYLWIKKDLFK
jgi:hypothetical protein